MERILLQRVRAAGLNRPAPVAFAASLAVHAALLAVAVAASGWIDHLAWRLACAALLALAMVQVGFAGHDAEHGGGGRRSRLLLGLLCWNLLLGISASWWRDKHRRHHRETHVVGKDPDLYALYAYEGGAIPTGLHAAFVRHQAWLFWPLTAAARAYYQVASVGNLVRGRGSHGAIELTLIALHHATFWYAAFAAVGDAAPAMILVGYALTGIYMGLVFGPNHLGCPHASAAVPGRLWQVASTRNIRSGPLGDYFCGGLNLQIEHHLLPSASRFRLRGLQPVVREFCREQGVPYRESGFLQAVREIHHSLAAVSKGRR